MRGPEVSVYLWKKEDFSSEGKEGRNRRNTALTSLVRVYTTTILSFALLLLPGVAVAFPAASTKNIPWFVTTVIKRRNLSKITRPTCLFSNVNGDTTARRPPKGTRSVTTTVEDLEAQLSKCTSGTSAQRILEAAFFDSSSSSSSAPLPLYNSISIPPDSSAKGLSDGDLAIMTRIRNNRYSIMELIELNGDRDADRASLAVGSVLMASSLSALIANQHFPGPDILRFLVVWIFSFAPLALVGYGLSTPASLQAVLVRIQSVVFPQYRRRMIQHEAGHFLVGHLLGLPVQTYQTNAVKNAVTFYPLNDPEVGIDRAKMLGFDDRKRNTYDDETDTSSSSSSSSSSPSYFSDEGRGSQILNRQSVFRREADKKMNYTKFLQIDSVNEPSKAWPYRGFDEVTIDKLSAVSVAGVCAELLAFGNAEGGLADFNQLKQLFQSTERKLNEPPLSEREIDNSIRFALGYTISQLRRHLGVLDALADVMENGGSIAECIMAIETCNNVSGNNDGIFEKYEIRRKERFQQTNPVLAAVERVLLGEPKTADVSEDRFVEGKGGGYKKQRFVLTGDDPLYLALGVASVFLLWASSGGLSLH